MVVWIRASEKAVTSSFCLDGNITSSHLARTFVCLKRQVQINKNVLHCSQYLDSFSSIPQEKEGICLFLHFFTMKFSVSFGLRLFCILLVNAPWEEKGGLSWFLSHYREQHALILAHRWSEHQQKKKNTHKKSKAHRKFAQGVS